LHCPRLVFASRMIGKWNKNFTRFVDDKPIPTPAFP
jgi:hypothetical protein